MDAAIGLGGVLLGAGVAWGALRNRVDFLKEQLGTKASSERVDALEKLIAMKADANILERLEADIGDVKKLLNKVLVRLGDHSTGD